MAAQARIYASPEHSNAAFEHRTGHTATLVGEYIILFGGQIEQGRSIAPWQASLNTGGNLHASLVL